VKIDDYVTEVRNVQWARVASDTAGNIFCAWTDQRDGHRHIWSSVSTDRGATWGANVRVSKDTNVLGGYTDIDVSVQPGTNQYVVAARWGYYTSLSVETEAYVYEIHLYRSTDGGLSFQSSVRLDTFGGFVSTPSVVADRDHIICDYTGNPAWGSGNERTESRTFYAGPDTWGDIVAVSDTMFRSYYHGGKLALSPDGRVHTALMVYDANWRIHYAISSDHGASWSGHTRVSDGGDGTQFPDIGVDSEGYAYLVWCDLRNHRNELWFSTNRPLAIAEEPTQQSISAQPSATVVRRVLSLPQSLDPSIPSCLLDISGREIMNLKPGANDVRALAPGVYFVREQPQAASSKLQAVRKIILTE